MLNLLLTEEMRMLKNLRVVVTRVRVSAPNMLIVRKMKSWPSAPLKQNTITSRKDFGCAAKKLISSKPTLVIPNM
jgi:hypothetical protein